MASPMKHSAIEAVLVAEYGPAVLTTCSTSTMDHRRWKNRWDGYSDKPMAAASVKCGALAKGNINFVNPQ